jgi:hypothetical protein
MAIEGMRITCWITNAAHTNTHTEYIIPIAFSTTKIVAQTRLNVPQYVCVLPVLFLCLCGFYYVGEDPAKGRSFVQVALAYANK